MNIVITSRHRIESLLELSFVRRTTGVLISSQSNFVYFNVDPYSLSHRFIDDQRIEHCKSEEDAKNRFIKILERKREEKFTVDSHGVPAWCIQAFIESGWKGTLETFWNPWIFSRPPKRVISDQVFRVCQTAQLYLLSLVSENKVGDVQEWGYEVQRYIQSHVGSRFGQVVGIDKRGGILSYEFVVSKLGVQSYISGSIVLGEMESNMEQWGVEVLRDFESAVREIQNGMTSSEVQKQVVKILPRRSIVKIEPLWAKTLWMEGDVFSLENEGAYYIQAWVNMEGGEESGEVTGILRMSNVVRIEQNQCDFEYVFLPEMIRVP